LGQIQQASAGSQDFFAVLNTKTEVVDAPNATHLEIPATVKGSAKKAKDLVIFNEVSFEYESGKNVLEKVSFGIQPNEKFALVGESGQGKSTIVNLLLRYYQPQQGQILIADQDISQVTQASLHEKIAVVFQDSLLFSGSIMENIKYGSPDASDEQAIAAAKAANAEEFIVKLPEGYQSMIGERGVKLSGGQKQRLAIARAMLKDAPIIILDEATSALDSKSELLVQEGLERLLRNRTAIIIAHRLSTIANADHILVIAEGKIAQYGSAQELLKQKDGLYAQLVKLQQRVATGKAKVPEGEVDPELKKFDLVG
jgi:ATP-binding cassette subfamily B protein